MTRQPDEQCFASCPRGLESLLAEELRQLGAQAPTSVPGGVLFGADRATRYRANLESRFATRVLLRLGRAAYRDEQDIYEAALALPWHRWFSPSLAIRVDVNAVRSPLRSLEFATLRIKDAVCDAFRRAAGCRPNVDTRSPDVRIHAFLDAAQVTLYLDTSGEPLYKRGYRAPGAEAPLKENLAAGLVALAGWQADEPLLDPMCGSGTLLVEAATRALGIAPGSGRSFGFERLRDFDRQLWNSVRERAQAAEQRGRALALYGSDLHPSEVERARRALRAAGLEGAARLKQAQLTDLRPPAELRGRPGVILMNPPYGLRMGERVKLAALYPQIGDWLKRHFAGWRCYIFSGDPAIARAIRLHPTRRTPLHNGPIECRLYEYRMVAGAMRRRPAIPPEKRPPPGR
jgi:putative N6-adenine-specific DNA methylase